MSMDCACACGPGFPHVHDLSLYIIGMSLSEPHTNQYYEKIEKEECKKIKSNTWERNFSIDEQQTKNDGIAHPH